ncbi:MAG: hypothetical protein HOC70_02630 [Gammaproteobacteria bacterium]|nr:hypothetical protein [Gammaproteobacteria bacterium]MBT7371096.1 hypothetical protein [Gammaproteobacteria bacterium]
MTKFLKLPRMVIAIVFVLATSSACTTTQVVSSNSTPAKQSSTLIPLDELLDIGIEPLEPGIPDDPDAIDKALIVPDVRRAESSYIAYHLKDTLELTGNWGAVRVTPEPSNAVDLHISGRIVQSDGELIKVSISAHDATGKLWYRRTYDDLASKFSYQKPVEDPFQDLYNKIADDLLEARELMSRGQIVNIKTIANLKFANDLAPDAFDGYLEASKRGQLSITQLPAVNDTMLKRVDRIKEQEYLFVDTLDDYYSRFHREMKPSYDEWRQATYEEAIRLREMQRQSRNRLLGGALLIAGGLAAGSESDTWAGDAAAAGAVVGGIGSIKSGLDRRKEAEIHAESLRELSQSLGTEITPYVLDIEGRTIELVGTAEEQYTQWRQILRDIYAEETGVE